MGYGNLGADQHIFLTWKNVSPSIDRSGYRVGKHTCLSPPKKGWCLDLHVLDDCTMHDSSAICEILALTIEKVHRIATEQNRAMPTSIFLCADNCVREAKNSIVMSMLINLTAQHKFRTSGLLTLRKSHTHDLLDQCLISNLNSLFFLCYW